MWGVAIVRGDGEGKPPSEDPPPPPDDPPPTPTGDAAVSAVDDLFDPDELHVELGDTVVWTNEGKNAHTVTNEDGLFHSGNMAAGDSFSFTFEAEGTYSYICKYHLDAGMAGVVIVEAPPEGGAEVSADDDVFEPSELTVSAGETIKWTNNGRSHHTVTSSTDAAPLDSGDLTPGDSFSHTFTEPGTYTYYCTYHSDPVKGTGMVGTVVVEESSQSPPPTRAGAFAAISMLLALPLWPRFRRKSGAFAKKAKRTRPQERGV